jgi:hypothetical protein
LSLIANGTGSYTIQDALSRDKHDLLNRSKFIPNSAEEKHGKEFKLELHN